MRAMKVFLTIGALVLALLEPYWAHGQGPMQPSVMYLALASSTGTQQPLMMDDLLVEVGRREPSFGGLFTDWQNKILNIYVLDPSQIGVQGSVEVAIASVFGPNRLPPGGTRLLPSRYGIAQLWEWYQPLRERAFSISGVTATDLWEGNNLLWVGIKDLSGRGQVEALVDSLGIPREAVVIEQWGPVVPTSHTLDSTQTPPIDAGVKVTNTTKPATCTMGPVAKRDGALGFLVDHHCTRTRAQVDNDNFYQPNDPGNFVGQETVDSPWFGNAQDPNCPVGRNCRYSDSALVTGSAVGLDLGFIARTTGIGTTSIDHNNPTFRIRDRWLAGQGDVVQIVGRASGWQAGSVVHTCMPVDDPTDAANPRYLCQDFANYPSANTDSSAPVFMDDLAHPGDYLLVGMHWGRPSLDQSAYAYIGNVFLDLGQASTWNVCAPVFGC